MVVEKAIKILNEIIKKTREGRLQWEKTHREDTFQISLTDYSIQIEREERFDIAMNDKYFAYRLKFFDERGRLIEDFDQSDLLEVESNASRALHELFVIARRSANKTEKALDDILNELENNV
ncbi:MAG: hypothetical protein GXO78_00925 [Calditrichaeota bacterium]|nr:hypothetical protein [Calditrichota bacterium]